MDRIDPKAAALVIQDLQNDVIIEGGAFADSGAPAHATSQNVVENVEGPRRRLPRRRRAGDPRLVHRRARRAGPEAERAALPGRQGGERARPRHAGARRRPTGSSRRTGDHVVEKMRMNGFYETRLDILLRGLGVETLIISGAWTNMSIEHTARHAADAGYRAVVASDGTSTVERRVAERGAQLRDAERRHGRDLRRDRRARSER